MILLTTTSDKIQIGISPAVTLDIHASFMDASGTVTTPGRQNGQTTVETSKDIVDPPASGSERAVKAIHIRNTHASDSSSITVKHIGGLTVELQKVTLLAGEKLSYVEKQGFRVYDSDGAIKS